MSIHLATFQKPPVFSSRIRRFHSSTYQRGDGPIDPDPSYNPDVFDVLISDVNHDKLGREVSKALGHEYLTRTQPPLKPLREINGVLFGFHRLPSVS
jgi:hypothetical protein